MRGWRGRATPACIGNGRTGTLPTRSVVRSSCSSARTIKGRGTTTCMSRRRRMTARMASRRRSSWRRAQGSGGQPRGLRVLRGTGPERPAPVVGGYRAACLHFHNPHGTQRIAITYNAALQRYILTTSHLPPGMEATHTAALGVFDAPEPWGPWTTVYYDDHWSVVDGKDCRTYHHKFPAKWMSVDGREMWLLYSGLDGGLYAFCLKKARLEVRKPDGSDGDSRSGRPVPRRCGD